jgi:hypothetical protein
MNRMVDIYPVNASRTFHGRTMTFVLQNIGISMAAAMMIASPA